MNRRDVADALWRMPVRLFVAGVVLATTVAVMLISPIPSNQPTLANGVGYGCGGTSSAVFSSGAGTVGDPYIVTNSAQLAAVSASAQNLAAHYLQQCDIDLVAAGYTNWSGIGGGTNDNTGSTASYDAFTGVYDGNGKTISNVSVSVSSGHGHGLFRNAVGATIRNVNLNGVTIAATGDHRFIGSLVGHAIDSTVSGVTATGLNVSVTRSTYYSHYIGGLVGMGEARGGASMSIVDATVAGVVTTSGRANYVGGVVGEFFTVAQGSQLVLGNAHTAVDLQAASTVGGLIGRIASNAGFASTTVSGSSASGALDVGEEAGGVIGSVTFVSNTPAGSNATMTITDVTSSAHVVASGWAAGGLIGSIYMADASTLQLDHVGSAGDVTAAYDSVGGLIGYVSGQRLGPVLSIEHSTVTGDITGASHSVGGVVGRAQASTGNLSDFTVVIASTTVSGSVTGAGSVSNDGVGGFVGRLRVDTGGASNIDLTVLDSTASGPVTGPVGVGGVVGKMEANAGTARLSVGNTAITAPVAAADSEAGGVVGRAGGHVTLSAVTRSGDVTVPAGSGYAAGGFVGYDNASSILIDNSTSSSDVAGKFEIGGAVGYVRYGAVLRDVRLSGDVSGQTDTGCYVGTSLDENEPLLTRQGSTTAMGTKTVGGVTSSCPGATVGGGGGVVLPPAVSELVTQPVVPSTSTTVPSTSTTTPRPPTTTMPPASTVPAPVPDGDELPTLVPGVSQVIENGVPVEVERFVDNSTDLVLRSQDFELRLAGECTNGCTIATTADGREVLTLEERGLAKVTGEGFLAGTPVYVWLFSEPRFLGELTVNADGTFTGNVPLGDIAPGEHTLQVNGTSFDGLPRTANLGVIVNPTAAPSPGGGDVLPATGTDSAPLWLVALVLLGAGLVATSRRRGVSGG